MRALLVVMLMVACQSPSLTSTALCGDPDAPPAVDVAPTPDAPRPQDITLILGQSNAVGQGTITEVDPMWSTTFPAVYFATKTASGTNDPPVVARYAGVLKPRGHFGAELSLGRRIPDADIAICAGGGYSLATQWDPFGTYPTGQNWYSGCLQFAHELESQLNGRVTRILWFQGEADAKTQTDANNYGENMVEIGGLLLAEFPCSTFHYYRLKTPGNFAGTVRAEEDWASATDPRLVQVDVSSVPTYGQHFTSQGYIDLGNLFGDVLLAAPQRCP